jgi:NAD(P)-dependent dehydrogenase (short-subunit alcohol dehydrogenase family)
VTEFPDFSLDGKVALVTASGRGLGRAIAIALAHAGADVALGLRDRASAGDVVEAITELGRRAVPLQMNMTSLLEIRKATADAHDIFGRLDILVNNAGIAPGAPAASVTEEDFDATLEVNLRKERSSQVRLRRTS